MNKISAAFLALLLMTFIGACSQPQNVNSSQSQQTASEVKTSTESTKASVQILPATSETTESKDSTKTSTTDTKAEGSQIADGSYTTKGSYVSPAQTEDVEFTFVMKDGAVQDVTLVSFSSVPVSKKFQEMFMDGIKKEVVGKKLSEIGTYDRLNGSSLTPAGFNQAMEELKKKA